MKKINIIIENCAECPYIKEYCEWPGFYCGNPHCPTGQYKDFLDHKEDIKKCDIPKWCPLKDK